MTIVKVERDRRDEVADLLGEFITSMDERKRPGQEMIDQLLSLWSEGNIELLGKFDDADNLLGIVVLSLASNRLSFVYIRTTRDGLEKNKRNRLERDLFDAGFAQLKKNESWVTTGESGWLSENLIKHALKVGFERYEQIGMEASRETLEKVQVPQMPPGYSLVNYEDKWKETIARLFYDSFKNSPDRNAEPDTIATEERCLALVDDTIANRWGNFKNGRFSWVLKFKEEIVGVSLFTIFNVTTGFGVGMCLNPLHRGKGLGRLMFTHSLRSILDSEPDVKEMKHANLSTNIMLPLHKSLGFKETSRYAIYTWHKSK